MRGVSGESREVYLGAFITPVGQGRGEPAGLATASPQEAARILAASPGAEMVVETADHQRVYLESDMVMSQFLGRASRPGAQVSLVVNDYNSPGSAPVKVEGHLVAADRLNGWQRVKVNAAFGAMAIGELFDRH